nr:NapC/NirT family cytochrome c [Rhodoferax sp.]
MSDQKTPLTTSERQSPGTLGRAWSALRRPSAKFSLLLLLVVGFFSGIIFWGGFHTVVEATNTEKFCIGCHEMRDNVYAEYKKTTHYSNRTGVRAVCSDCHVPKEWGPKMWRKVQATGELYGKIMGTIDTREKFEAKRLILAEREWKRMRANDSLECRNCHSLESMAKDAQTATAWRRHKGAKEKGETCIDCHKGIAHTEPGGAKKEKE